MKRVVTLFGACAVAVALLGCRTTKATKRQRHGANQGASQRKDSMDNMLRTLSIAANCETTLYPRSPWCAVVERWSVGIVGDLPSKRALLGFRVALSETGDGRGAIQHQTRLAALAIRSDPGSAKVAIAELVPSDDNERRELSLVLEPLQGVLGGYRSHVVLGDALYRFIAVDGLVSHTLMRESAQWRFDGPVETVIRQLDDVWAIVERVRDEPWEFRVSVMTDRIESSTTP